MIIGIHGKAGSGKDTFASHLIKMAHESSHRLCGGKIAFADPIKRYAKDAFDFSDEQLWGTSEKRNAPDKRYPRKHDFDESGQCFCCGAYEKDDTECYLTPRYSLQLMGSQWGRKCYDNIWVQKGVNTANYMLTHWCSYTPQRGVEDSKYVPNYNFVIISDLRFENEAYGLRKAGATLIKVKRPVSSLTGASANHDSEWGLPDVLFDEIILNDSDLSSFFAKTQRFLNDTIVTSIGH